MVREEEDFVEGTPGAEYGTLRVRSDLKARILDLQDAYRQTNKKKISVTALLATALDDSVKNNPSSTGQQEIPVQPVDKGSTISTGNRRPVTGRLSKTEHNKCLALTKDILESDIPEVVEMLQTLLQGLSRTTYLIRGAQINAEVDRAKTAAGIIGDPAGKLPRIARAVEKKRRGA